MQGKIVKGKERTPALEILEKKQQMILENVCRFLSTEYKLKMGNVK